MSDNKKPVLMQLTVFDPANDDEVIQEYAINYSSRETKEWLTRLIVWAMFNNKVVELSPLANANIRLFEPKAQDKVA